MAFAARNEDGKWILCLRKGRSIHFYEHNGERGDIVFPNQKAAKACADELNEKFWKEFERGMKKKERPPCAQDMVDTIKQHMAN